jgi:hypothetical protein
MQPEQITPTERAALERLLDHARGDTHQSRRVADFLLAWWNAGACGAYDITTGWAVDEAIADDMCVVFRLATRARSAGRSAQAAGSAPPVGHAPPAAWRAPGQVVSMTP